MNWVRTLTRNIYNGECKERFASHNGGGGRDLSLDVVKAILIVCVVLGHAMREGSCAGAMNGVVGFIYHFHMPLFVLICGYFFRVDTPFVMVRKICLRYWLPYISGGMLFVVGLWAVKGISPVESFGNLLVGKGLGAMWFLYTIAAIETIFCVAHAAFIRNRDLGVLVAVGLFLLAIEAPIRVESWSVLYFMCGMFIKGNMREFKYGWVFGVLAATVYCMEDLPWYTELSLISMCFVLCVGILLRWVAGVLLELRVGKFLAWLGRGTLVILIFHPLFNLVMSCATHCFATVDRTGLSFWIVEAVVGIAGSMLVGKLLRLIKLNVLFGLRA